MSRQTRGQPKGLELLINMCWHTAVTDIWEELGLQKMPVGYDTKSIQSGGSRVSEESVAELDAPLFSPRRLRLS